MTASPQSSTMGRPADSLRRIVLDLRSQIVAGELAPGTQMPTRVVIEKQFGAGKATVQRALEELRRDGFVDVNGKQGTFVSHYPPHLSRYAVIFPELPSNLGWNRFWGAIKNEVTAIEQSGSDSMRLPLYYGINNDHSSATYLQLEREVRSHCLAGLIFMSRPFLLQHTALLDESGMPRVGVMAAHGAEMPVVNLNSASFREKALRYLQSKGKIRVAIIGAISTADYWAEWTRDIVAMEMYTEPYWAQTTFSRFPEAARNLAHLLMSGTPAQRPEALIVQDDNLVPHVIEGLMAAGIRVPDDLEVVAHCNYPLQESDALPVQRLGYDARKVIGACIESIDHQRRGETVAPQTLIDAEFAAELK